MSSHLTDEEIADWLRVIENDPEHPERRGRIGYVLTELLRLRGENAELRGDRDGIVNALIESARLAGLRDHWDACPSEILDEAIAQRDEASDE